MDVKFLKGYDKRVKALIANLIKELEANGVLEDTDRTMFVMLAEAYWMYLTATEHIKEVGITLVSDRGNVVANPSVKIQKDAQKTILQILTECGCTPKARQKLEVLPEEDNPFESLINDEDD